MTAVPPASLADVLPSALAALGLADEPNRLDLAAAPCVVVLLVDGLGWTALRRNADAAPFLSGLAGRPLAAPFPATTAVSVPTLGTGVLPGRHGMVGYQTRLDGLAEPVNWLTWRTASSAHDITGEHRPEDVQPVPTAFERARAAGLPATVVSAAAYRRSGLTRAALRGADYVGAYATGDLAALVADAARDRGGLVYCYLSELDLVGHIHGTASAAWRTQLSLVDRAAELLAADLPDGARLLVTADHGMVDVADDNKIDYDTEPLLQDGVELVAGEARARYLHAAAGDRDGVVARWRQVLGPPATVVTREDAIDLGWFGPLVTSAAHDRIGDVVALPGPGTAVVRRRAESRSAALIGHHGGRTEDEAVVPLLVG